MPLRQQKGKLKRVLTYHFRRRGAALLLGLLFLLGAAAGTAAFTRLGSEELQLLQTLLQREQQDFWQRFLPEGAQLLLLFFCGFCAVGQPCGAFLLFYRGLGLGLIGTFFAAQGRSAFLHYALQLLPQSLMFLLIQMAASREAMAFSLNFLRQLLGNSPRNLSISPRIYILRFLILLLLTALAAFGGTLLQQLL